MKALKILTFILVIIGAINWGLVGIFDLDLVALMFGDMSILSRVVYIVVGISAIICSILLYETIFYEE